MRDAQVPPQVQGGPLRAFAYPPFRIFWGASLASMISFFMATIARGWLVLDMTNSAFMVTAVNAVGMLPMLFFSLFGGVIADRVNRRLVLMASDGFNLGVMLALSLLIVTDAIQVWQLLALAILHGVGFALGMPARAATVSNLVGRRELASGMALFTTIFSSAQLVGPAMAGYFLNTFGMGVPFVVSCLLLVPALALLLALRIPPTGHGSGVMQRGSVLRGIVQGLEYVRKRPTLIGLILMGLAATVFGMPYQTLLPVFARDILHVGADGLGWLGALGGAGAIVGSFTVAFFSGPRPIRLLMLVGGIGLGMLIVLFALSTVYLLSLVLSLALGFIFQIFMTSNFTLVQVISADHIRGRVLSIRMIALGLSPVGMLLLGSGAQVVGPARATAIMGAIALVFLTGILVAIPSLRRGQASQEDDGPVPSEEYRLPAP